MSKTLLSTVALSLLGLLGFVLSLPSATPVLHIERNSPTLVTLTATSLERGILYDFEQATDPSGGWERLNTFRPQTTAQSLSLGTSQAQQFFRARRVTPLNDVFEDRCVIMGSNITTNGTIRGATLDSQYPAFFSVAQNVWYEWTAPVDGHVFFWAHTAHLQDYSFFPYLMAFRDWPSPESVVSSSINNDIQFDALAGATYQFAVEGYAPDQSSRGDFRARLVFSQYPQVELLSPGPAAVHYKAPATIPLSAVAFDPDGQVNHVLFLIEGGPWRVAVSNAPYTAVFTNVTPGLYTVLARAFDNWGVPGTSIGAQVRVTPANDDFLDRIPVTGTNLLLRGENASATREVDEPVHADTPGSHSIWWSWTAPQEGAVTIDRASPGINPIIAVYRGESLAALTPVASRTPATGAIRFEAEAGAVYQIAVDSPEAFGTILGGVRVTVILDSVGSSLGR